jgi:hypothetical protein
MKAIVSIDNNDTQIELKARKYKILLLGGWGVTLGNFSISFRHIKTGEIIECRKTLLPVQSYNGGIRAKRIFSITIDTAGTYAVEFTNQHTLKVKKSNLFITSLFEDFIPTKDLRVCID